MTKFKETAQKTAQFLSVALVVIEIMIIVSIVITKISGQIPSIFGYHFYVIASPSMSPDLEVGDIIISRQYDGGELAEGQIVEYLGKSGKMEGKIITHRIVKISGEGNDRVIITKGTANSDEDPPISPDDIIAVMTYKTVIIDKIYAVLSTTVGFILLVMLPMMAMIVTEIVRLMIEVKGEKNGKSDN